MGANWIRVCLLLRYLEGNDCSSIFHSCHFDFLIRCSSKSALSLNLKWCFSFDTVVLQ